ncbi:hypothetical protein [Variovorax sp. OV329]|uniref:hypothetical protein n=1 Tax=Variovorax sp. OV329 TaxID=1882825 RepID=UPI0008E49CC0|nr:hypothetical protein [Variovorax sp. OV329]SFN25516.1 hypothetical protein SAMN05444747_119102 [Variovorax sp. OV329]
MRQAIEKLMGIVEAMVADGDLHDLEIEFLRAWLAENPDVALVWPGNAVSGAIEAVLADGHVSPDERDYLVATLRQLASGELALDEQDGAAGLALLFDNATDIQLRDSLVCLAGDFLHGTKPACERLLERAGGWPAAMVGPNVRFLVVGSKVAPDWSETPLGQTIRDALSLQQAGHPIAIVSERRWLDRLAGTAAS